MVEMPSSLVKLSQAAKKAVVDGEFDSRSDRLFLSQSLTLFVGNRGQKVEIEATIGQGTNTGSAVVEKVKFRAMKDGDKADYELLERHEVAFAEGTADRLLNALKTLDESLSGYQVTRLEHSLQSATRAWRDGADTDWVVSALLHDIGDIFAPYNHDEYAAAILRPFVREQCAWVVEKHGDFQLIYYGTHVGADPMKRDAYKGHLYFDDCAEFCARWDQSSFDPDYDMKPLEDFAPLVREVFARKAYDPDVIRAGEREPLAPGAVAN